MYFDTSVKTSRRDCSGISCHALVVYFQQYKKRAKAKGNKKCHTETMRGKKNRYNLYIREPLMYRLGRTSRSKNKGRS
jgi:hypothetical protein